VKASALIAEAANVLQSRSSSGHNSVPTPRPRGDRSGPGLSERGPPRSKSQGTRQLARIEGVVTEIQRELHEVRILSDSFEVEADLEKTGLQLQAPAQSQPVLRYSTLGTLDTLGMESLDRKWRANAEHILKIESSWAQRVKDAEEATSMSDERARFAEEAHGRLLREKAEMVD
ncbi:unnamed protein product, partial [Symbiodinium pilosum]